MWNVFKWATIECVRDGKTVVAYGCTFRRAGDFMAIDLPSGWQTIWYYQPAMRPRATDRGVEYQPSYKAMKTGKWTTVFLYGGIICENIVQALARGILCEAMGRLNYRENRPLVLSVHDEAVAEVPEDRADIKRFAAVMEERSPWIEKMGVPIAVEAWTGDRYKK
jgi:DNA polymerase